MLQGRQAPQFSTVAGFSPDQLASQDLIRARALGGSPLIDASTQSLLGLAQGSPELQATARGDFLDPASNPFLQRTFDTAADAVSNRINSQFELAGRTASPANQSVLTRDLGNLANSIFGQNFQQERNRQLAAQQLLGQQQLSAAGLSPTIANQAFSDAAQLGASGAQQQQQEQRNIADRLFRFNFPFENLIQATGLFNQNIAGLAPFFPQTGTAEGTQTQTTRSSPLSTALGLGLVGSSIFGNPFRGLFGGSNPGVTGQQGVVF